jgi:hypothetical protein
VRVGNNLSVPICGKKRYQLPISLDGQKVACDEKSSVGTACGKDYWPLVKQLCWQRIEEINRHRIEKRKPEEDDIPM